jgi:streptogramin lyase
MPQGFRPPLHQRTIFVSHTHADNALCDRYVAELRRYGFDVWYDRTNLQAGHHLSDDIQQELERRQAFIVLLTPSAVNSFWVKAEIDAYRSLMARNPSRLMVPVRILPCEVPLLLQGLKWVDATAMPFDAAIAELAATLGAPIDQKRVTRSTRRWQRGRRLRAGCTGLAAVVLIAALVTGLLKLLPVITGGGPSGTPTATTGSTVTTGPSLPDHTFSSFTVPTANSNPQGITAGPDGNLWFTEGSGNKIGRVTPDGKVTEFPLPSANAIPEGIVTGPDGNLWFTEGSASVNKIGRMTTSGIVAEFAIPSASSFARSITVGADSNLWFTEEGTGKIGRITTDGVVTEFTVRPGNSFISSLAKGPDGNIWFTEGTANYVGRITPDGIVAEFPMPSGGQCPLDITKGPDNNLWFREGCARNVIGKVTVTGDITEYPFAGTSDPGGITAGSDGALWFLSQYRGADKIGRMTTDGSVTEYTLSTTDTFGRNITSGPDGYLWFAVGDAIGRFTP